MSKKNTIRLTESDLKRVITETVKNVLKENSDHMEGLKGEMWEAFFNLGEAIDHAGCEWDPIAYQWEQLRDTMEAVCNLLNDYYMQLYNVE